MSHRTIYGPDGLDGLDGLDWTRRTGPDGLAGLDWTVENQPNRGEDKPKSWSHQT